MSQISTSESSDAYRESFKYYKNFSFSQSSPSSKGSKKSQPISNGDNDTEKDNCVISKNKNAGDNVLLPYPIRQLGGHAVKREVVNSKNRTKKEEACQCFKMWGLQPPETWNVVELTFPEGLIVIKNPFTSAGQRYWISRALLDFPHHQEYITNMDNLNRLEKVKRNENVDDICDFKLNTSSRDFYQKLRWVTFGYHHDWDTKIYSEKMRSQFPEDLADMTRYISQVLQFSNFEAEAAIANYYHMDSTLSGHVDRSEVNQRAPLFSLSFGQSAIFLIGGKTKIEVPQPVLLQSGDIAVMSGESRLSYHGVPKILPAETESWNSDYNSDESVSPVSNGENGSSCKRQKLDASSAQQFLHNCTSFRSTINDPKAIERIGETNWTDFTRDYINKSRINLNIRQVLFPGQAGLS